MKANKVLKLFGCGCFEGNDEHIGRDLIFALFFFVDTSRICSNAGCQPFDSSGLSALSIKQLVSRLWGEKVEL